MPTPYTDMSALKEAINTGNATYNQSHCKIGGVHNWYTLTNGVWGLTTANTGLKMQENGFLMIRDGTLEEGSSGGIIIKAGTNFRLQMVELANGWAGFATL